MMSRWPSVVSRPTFAPLRSSRALVATVVPCTMRSVLRRSPSRSVPHSAASSPSPSSRPSDWSCGVEAHLAMTTRPVSSTAARSVNVPPTSIPIRHISLIEPLGVALVDVLGQLLDGARGFRLVPEHLRGAGQLVRPRPALGLPERRPDEGLRAMEVHLLDLDADGELRPLAHGLHGR